MICSKDIGHFPMQSANCKHCYHLSAYCQQTVPMLITNCVSGVALLSDDRQRCWKL